MLGAAGFIGRALAERLISKFEQIVLYGRNASTLAEQGKYEIFDDDFSDLARLKSALEGVDVVFHLISSTSPASSENDREFDVSSNLIGTLSLLKLCVESQVKRVVFASSGGTIYGENFKSNLSEKVLPAPICSYGISKLSIEHYLELFNMKYGMKNISLRISNPYGPGQTGKNGQGVIGLFMRAAKDRKPINIWARDSVRDYIYIDDLVSSFIAADEYDGSEFCFNIGSGIGRRLEDVINSIEAVTGMTLDKTFLPARPFDVHSNVLDVRKAQTELKWQASADWQESLYETWKWVSHN